MLKSNYYFCVKCEESWDENYEKQYGQCDSECPNCEKAYTPFKNKKERDSAIEAGSIILIGISGGKGTSDTLENSKNIYVRGSLKLIKSLVKGMDNVSEVTLLESSNDDRINYFLPKDIKKFLKYIKCCNCEND